MKKIIKNDISQTNHKLVKPIKFIIVLGVTDGLSIIDNDKKYIVIHSGSD